MLSHAPLLDYGMTMGHSRLQQPYEALCLPAILLCLCACFAPDMLDVQYHACEGAGVSIAMVVMRDRRTPNHREERWLLQNSVERQLFGSSGTGAVYRLLARCSLSTTPLALKKASVGTHVTRAELDQLLQILEDSLPLEAKGRVRSVTLLPLNVVVQCCKTLGRGPRTTALLTALAEPVPRLWELEAEREADAANLEYDPLLADDIAALEEEEAHFAAELCVQMAPFAVDADDERVATSTALSPVPAALDKELKARAPLKAPVGTTSPGTVAQGRPRRPPSW